MTTLSRTRSVSVGLWLASFGILWYLWLSPLAGPDISKPYDPSAKTSPIPASAASRQALAELSQPQQGIVSAALGRDDAAYHIATSGAGYRASNPAHHLTTDFGNIVLVRSAGTEWGMIWRGIGYREPDQLVQDLAVPSVEANHIEYRRGWATEWYANGPLGLEHNITIDRAPAGADGSTPLQIAFALAGNLQTSLDSDHRGMTLASSDGTSRLRYDGLVAVDAAGRELDAWIEMQPQSPGDSAAPGLLVRVDDRDALYPILIDPLIQTASLTATDGATDDLFGYSTAVSGDTIVVGAYNKSNLTGAAYVFQSTNWTTMTQTAKLMPVDAHEYDAFGAAVAISGSTIVVGARGFRDSSGDPGGASSPGAAYVYVRPGSGTWVTATQTATLTPSDGAAGDAFGTGVSIDGDTIAVGAYRHGYFWRGAAYVFVKPTLGGWITATQNAKLTASDPADGDAFGAAIAISGDTVLVGAPYRSNYTGAAYVFVKGSSWMTMTESALLTATDAAPGDYVGVSVSLSGDTALAGTYRYNKSATGAAYVFVRPGGGWTTATQTAKLTASDGAANDLFGFSVSIDGTRLVVGAPRQSPYEGAAYLFLKPPATGWVTTTETAKLTALPGASGNTFGNGVSIRGSVIVVGAPNPATNGEAFRFIVANYIYLPQIRR